MYRRKQLADYFPKQVMTDPVHVYEKFSHHYFLITSTGAVITCLGCGANCLFIAISTIEPLRGLQPRWLRARFESAIKLLCIQNQITTQIHRFISILAPCKCRVKQSKILLAPLRRCIIFFFGTAMHWF